MAAREPIAGYADRRAHDEQEQDGQRTPHAAEAIRSGSARRW